MLTSSAKAKGRNLQKLVRDTILAKFPGFTVDDVRSTSMGASGVDIQLSQQAQLEFPYAIECKAQEGIKKMYDWYEQARLNTKEDQFTAVVVRSNNQKPLVLISLDTFMRIA